MNNNTVVSSPSNPANSYATQQLPASDFVVLSRSDEIQEIRSLIDSNENPSRPLEDSFNARANGAKFVIVEDMLFLHKICCAHEDVKDKFKQVINRL